MNESNSTTSGTRHAPACAEPALARTIDELAHHCFGCGPGNPQGLHLHFEVNSENLSAITAKCIVNLTRMHEGPPGYLHGGIIATLMDEAMSKLNRPLDILAMTRHMGVDYLRPAPIGQPLTLMATHIRREGRKVFHEAVLSSADGTVLATAKGFFLVIDPAVIGRRRDGSELEAV